MFKARTLLVRVSPVLYSSYPVGAPRDQLKPLHTLTSGVMTPDAANALVLLNDAVLVAEGDPRVTDCHRDTGTQAAGRQRYETWLAANSPKPGTAGFNATTMKADYVAKPGNSFHNAGRAIDLDTINLKFKGVAPNLQLDRLWEIARPLGWTPVIKEAKEGTSESWHFDFHGPWKPVLARRGYPETAMAACLDVGVTAPFTRPPGQCLQAQLHRAGYDVGVIDGIVGKRTQAALAESGVGSACRDPEVLYALPDSATTLWS